MSNVGPPDPGADRLGPIDYLAVEFPDGRVGEEGFQALLELVERRVIQVLDLEFIAKDANGAVAKVDVGDLEATDAVNLAAWQGASSSLLDPSDVDEIGSAIQPGSVAGVMIYENRWVLSVLEPWRRSGARLIADGGIPAQDVVAALDATETT